MSRRGPSRAAPRGGYTLIELMMVLSMFSLVLAIIGPVSLRLLDAVGTEPRRIERQRMAGELLDALGQRVRTADALPAEAAGFSRDKKTLILVDGDVTLIYRIDGEGLAVVTVRDGEEAANRPPVPIAGEFELLGRADRPTGVRVRWQVATGPWQGRRTFEATFARRSAGGGQ